MKKRNALIATALLCVFLFSCKRELSQPPTGNSNVQLKSATVKGFTVSNGRLIDAYGNDFIIRGINYPYEWFTDKTTTGIPAVARTGANAIRLVLTFPTLKSLKNTNLLGLCKANNLIMILENHNSTGKNDTATLLTGTRYFINIKDSLIGNEDRMIINIANEWTSSNTGTLGGQDLWVSGYKKAITLLRNAGLHHTLMIDASNYGQYYQIIIDHGRELLDFDPDHNIIFSFHIYKTYGTTESSIKTAIDNVSSTNLPFCIGEFGWSQGGGTMKSDYIMSYCQEKKLGWLAWSWAGNSGSDVVLDMDKSANFDGSQITVWGDSVINGVYGLKRTSKICSVYNNLNFPAFEDPFNFVFGVSPIKIDLKYVNYAAYGKWSALFNDGVRFFNEDRTGYSSVCAGSRFSITDPILSLCKDMILGTKVCAKDVVCGLPNLWMRDPGSYISGNIYATGTINGNILTDKYAGTKFQNLYPKYTHIGQMIFGNLTHGFTSDPSKPIIIESGKSTYTSYSNALPPGDYGDFNIKSNNSIYFSPGHYSFKTFNTEPDVELYFPTNGIVKIIIDNGMTMKSRTRMLSMINGEKKGANPAKILFMIGGDNSNVEISNQVTWRGTLAAADSYVNINTNDEGDTNDGALSTTPNPTRYEQYSANGEIYGAIWGRYLTIHQYTNVYFVRFDWENANPLLEKK